MPRTAALVWVACWAGAHGEELRPLPGCGPLSVYCVACGHGVPCTLDGVRRLCGPDSGRDEARLSLTELRSAVHALGLYARSVEVDRDSIGSLHCPAILYLRPARLAADTDVGHFLVLQEVVGDRVRIVDWTRRPEPVETNTDLLLSVWDGDCLEISTSPFLIPTAVTWRSLWLLTGLTAGLAMVWDFRRRAGRTAAGLMVWLLFSGCRQETPVRPSPRPPLSFTAAKFSAGQVNEGPPAKVECYLVVGDEPVAIAAVESTCSCLEVSQDLVGQTLPAGTRHTIRANLETREYFGDHGAVMKVTTNPPGPGPIECFVMAEIDSAPRLVGTVPLRLDLSANRSAELPVLINHFREQQVRPLKWDQIASRMADFTVVRTDVVNEEFASGMGSMSGRGSHDAYAFQLRPPAGLPIGIHSFQLEFAWQEDRYPPLLVPVEVNVRHPVHCSVERLFFGLVAPESSRSAQLEIENWDAAAMQGLSITSDFPGVVPAIDRETGRVQLTLHSPEQAGRLETCVHIHWGTFPVLTIPVSAVVAPNVRP